MATIVGTDSNDFIHMAGDGQIPPHGYNDIAATTDGGDSIDPGGGYNIVWGGGGADTISSGAGLDTIYGGAGFDHFILALNGEATTTTAVRTARPFSPNRVPKRSRSST